MTREETNTESNAGKVAGNDAGSDAGHQAANHAAHHAAHHAGLDRGNDREQHRPKSRRKASRFLPLRLDLQFSAGGQQRLAWILEWGRDLPDDTVLPEHWREGAAQTQPVLIGWVLGGAQSSSDDQWRRVKSALAPAVAAAGDGPFHQSYPLAYGAMSALLALSSGVPALLISAGLYATVLLLFAGRAGTMGSQGAATVARHLASRPFDPWDDWARTGGMMIGFGGLLGYLFGRSATIHGAWVFLVILVGLGLSRFASRVPSAWLAGLGLVLGWALTVWLG